MRLYVGNLAYSVTERELRDMFEEYGSVKSAQIPIDRTTQQSKGFGFVEYDDSKSAAIAITQFDGAEHKGRRLKVNEARPRD